MSVKGLRIVSQCYEKVLLANSLKDVPGPRFSSNLQSTYVKGPEKSNESLPEFALQLLLLDGDGAARQELVTPRMVATAIAVDEREPTDPL